MLVNMIFNNVNKKLFFSSVHCHAHLTTTNLMACLLSQSLELFLPEMIPSVCTNILKW